MTREELYRDFYPYAVSQLRWLMDVLDSDLSVGIHLQKSETPYMDAYRCLAHCINILTRLQSTMDNLFDEASSTAETNFDQLEVLQTQLREFRTLLRSVKYP